MCQKGLVEPTPCRNHSHTHCIVSWYRSGGSKADIYQKVETVVCTAPGPAGDCRSKMRFTMPLRL
ncbi:unnamed protein product [Nippostrongylus brasiliensis]|uniref:RING-type domain-containing protein n=1 Tax=Nippostrongylus brasiliensis TaxID=27835 RepID=A0A0N4XC95_NIPBR|nr:unnamed protein product [Nippostrongylus brasiliensis]